MTTPLTSANKIGYKFPRIVKDLSMHTSKKHGYTGDPLIPTADDPSPVDASFRHDSGYAL